MVVVVQNFESNAVEERNGRGWSGRGFVGMHDAVTPYTFTTAAP
jgi:hypothetical protein